MKSLKEEAIERKEAERIAREEYAEHDREEHIYYYFKRACGLKESDKFATQAVFDFVNFPKIRGVLAKLKTSNAGENDLAECLREAAEGTAVGHKLNALREFLIDPVLGFVEEADNILQRLLNETRSKAAVMQPANTTANDIPDGPGEETQFWYNGRKYDLDIRPAEWKLLTAIWGKQTLSSAP